MVPTEGGPRAGGSGTEVRFYDDEALTTLSTVYQRATGAGTQPNGAGAGACLKPNAGANSALLADRLAADTFVTVVDVTDFQVGDLVPIQDATNTVYRVITVITPATKRLDLDSTLGFAFLAAGTRVGNEDMKGHIWAYLDDARDYFVQVKDIASGRLLPPVAIPVRTPTTTIDFQEEGATVSTRGKINFVSPLLDLTDDGPGVRAVLTMTAPHSRGTLAGRPAAGRLGRVYFATDTDVFYFDDGAAWQSVGADATHATQHQPGGGDAMAVDAVAGTGSLRTLGTGAQQAAVGSHGHAHSSLTGIGASDHHKRTEMKETPGSANSESVTWTTAFASTPGVVPGLIDTGTGNPVGPHVQSRSTTGATIFGQQNSGGAAVKMVLAQEAT